MRYDSFTSLQLVETSGAELSNSKVMGSS
ncbi:hypothetical protein LINGRAHAP2_LOCUS32484 [Linum grandiflorum]